MTRTISAHTITNLVCWALAGALVACGGGTTESPPPAAPEATAASPAPAEPPPAEPKASEAAPAEPPKTDPPSTEPAASDAPGDNDPNAQRDVKYVVSPDGLKVEVEGTRFLVNAEPKKVGAGWGVRVKVSAQSLDDSPHTLTNPTNGPLAFAVAVARGGSSEATPEGDKREGDGELVLKKGKNTDFKRDWPGKGGKPLAIGDVIEIQMGLWGLGETKETRRPIKKFAVVKMKVDKGTPRAKVEPPPLK